MASKNPRFGSLKDVQLGGYYGFGYIKKESNSQLQQNIMRTNKPTANGSIVSEVTISKYENTGERLRSDLQNHLIAKYGNNALENPHLRNLVDIYSNNPSLVMPKGTMDINYQQLLSTTINRVESGIEGINERFKASRGFDDQIIKPIGLKPDSSLPNRTSHQTSAPHPIGSPRKEIKGEEQEIRSTGSIPGSTTSSLNDSKLAAIPTPSTPSPPSTPSTPIGEASRHQSILRRLFGALARPLKALKRALSRHGRANTEAEAAKLPVQSDGQQGLHPTRITTAGNAAQGSIEFLDFAKGQTMGKLSELPVQSDGQKRLNPTRMTTAGNAVHAPIGYLNFKNDDNLNKVRQKSKSPKVGPR